MNIIKHIFITVLIFLCSSATAMASEPFTSTQKQAIEQIIHNYLLNNPSVLMEASKTLQEQHFNDAIQSNAKSLFHSAASPVLGNKLGTIHVIEFFDYQCPYCKKMREPMLRLIKHNPEIRFVFKELPIFGQSSQYAATAALASNLQGKYQIFSNQLLDTKSRLSKSTVDAEAQKAGVDITKMARDMTSIAIVNEVKETYRLADLLGIQGTPAFIVGRYPATNGKFHFFSGAASEAELQKAIDAVKKESSK